MKEAERRQARIQPPHLRVRLALKRSALAYRRSTAALAAANNAAAQLQAHFLGRG
jgi:hypothetical protein